MKGKSKKGKEGKKDKLDEEAVSKARWDGRGLESIPLKLILISLILALSLPIVVSSWMSYDRQQTINQLTSEFAYIEGQMEQIYDGGLGVGNSVVLEVNIRDGTFAKIECVDIGDADLTSLRGKSIHWRLRGEEEHIYIISNGIPAKSEDGGSFRLRHGLSELYLEIKKVGDVAYVEVGYL